MLGLTAGSSEVGPPDSPTIAAKQAETDRWGHTRAPRLAAAEALENISRCDVRLSRRGDFIDELLLLQQRHQIIGVVRTGHRFQPFAEMCSKVLISVLTLIAKLGIPKEALPMLAEAMDTLEQAGVIPSDGDEGGGSAQSYPCGQQMEAHPE